MLSHNEQLEAGAPLFLELSPIGHDIEATGRLRRQRRDFHG
jgi:hypothetical protein